MDPKRFGPESPKKCFLPFRSIFQLINLCAEVGHSSQPLVEFAKGLSIIQTTILLCLSPIDKMAATVASQAPTEHRVKPTKPDEDAFKADLARAEEEYAAAQGKLVKNSSGFS
jgi:hypothetical protein